MATRHTVQWNPQTIAVVGGMLVLVLMVRGILTADEQDLKDWLDGLGVDPADVANLTKPELRRRLFWRLGELGGVAAAALVLLKNPLAGLVARAGVAGAVAGPLGAAIAVGGVLAATGGWKVVRDMASHSLGIGGGDGDAKTAAVVSKCTPDKFGQILEDGSLCLGNYGAGGSW